MHLANANAASAHGSTIHANQMAHTVHPYANPIYQRQDFQNRRSASEPVHELQAGNRANTASTDQSTTNNPNSSNEPNHQHGDDCNYVDCLQKITTVKVRCLPRHQKHNQETQHSIQNTPDTRHNTHNTEKLLQDWIRCTNISLLMVSGAQKSHRHEHTQLHMIFL